MFESNWEYVTTMFFTHYNLKHGKKIAPITWNITFSWTYRNHNAFILVQLLPIQSLKNGILMWAKEFGF
jgi:hypothetical protein